jgi:ParB family chromosome partitioning protein
MSFSVQRDSLKAKLFACMFAQTPSRLAQSAKSAIVVFGKHVGRTVTVCLDDECPVHTNHVHREPVEPPPVMAPPAEKETEEEAASRVAEHEQRLAEYQAEQERKEEEREAEYDRQQKEYEAEQARREKLQKARLAIFERIIEHAPPSFSATQMRVFLRLLINLDFSFLEEVATYFANGDENVQQSEEEIVLAALDNTTDEKLTGFALRLVLSDHVGIPHESQPDFSLRPTGLRAEEAEGRQSQTKRINRGKVDDCQISEKANTEEESRVSIL